MKKSRKFYALFCAFTVIMLCIPHVQAAPVLNPSFYDVGLGFGPGNVSSSSSSGEEPAQNQQEQQQQSNNAPASSQQTQTGSSSGDASSSGLTPEQIEQQQQQQNQLDNLNQQISNLQQQQSALQQQINATKDQKEQAAIQKANIDSQLYSTSQQIQLVNQKIALLQNNIDEANQQIGDLEVDAVECADSAARVDLHARHYAGDIAEIGGTGAPAVIVEDNFLSSAKCHAAVLSQLHECRIMILRSVTRAVAQLNACAHRQCGTGQRTVYLDILAFDRL